MIFKTEKESFEPPAKNTKLFQIRDATDEYFIQLTLDQCGFRGSDPLNSQKSVYNFLGILCIHRFNQL